MEQGKDKIKDVFSSKLKNFEADVPPFIWNDIERKIAPAPQQIAPARRMFFLRYASVAAVLLLIVSASFFLLNTSDEAVKSILMPQENALPMVELTPEDEKNEIGADAPVLADRASERSVVVVSRDIVREGTAVAEVVKDAKEPEAESKKVSANNISEANDVLAEKKDEKASESAKVESEDKNAKSIAKNDPKREVHVVTASDYADRHNKPKNKFIVGLNSNSSFSESESARDRGQVGLYSKSLDQEFAASQNQYTVNDDYVVEHNQPITLGLNVSKEITPKLSIETGVSYTYATSDIKSNGALKVDQKQSFYYLGVPLNVNYKFLELGDVDFYATAGIAIQKDVRGRKKGTIVNVANGVESTSALRSSEVVTDVGLVEVNEKLKQDHPQVSSRVSLGISYPVYKDVNIYGNIGGAYYFNAGNEHRTIYSDKRRQLDLNVGLKLNIN